MIKNLFVVFALIVSPAFGQVEAIIKGPDSVKIGDLVILNATDAIGANHKWVADPRTKDKVFEVADQKLLFFAIGTPGTYTFQLIVADTSANIDETKHSVIVESNTPSPPDVDDDNDNKDPLPPDTISAFTKEVTEWSRTVNDPDGAQALALVYRQSAESVHANTLIVSNALAAVRQASDSALSLSTIPTKWDVFRDKVGKEATLRTQKGILSSPRQMRDFLVEVMTGLELSASGSTTLEFGKILAITVSTTEAIKGK
jgi:hypothetical protein